MDVIGLRSQRLVQMAVVVVISACTASPPNAAPTPTDVAGPIATSTPVASRASASVAPPTARPTDGLVSKRYGLIVAGTSIYVRSETDPAPIIELDRSGAPSLGGAVAVSIGGNRVAVWTSAGTGPNELKVWDRDLPDRLQTLLRAPEGERGTGVAWSKGGEALLLSFDSLARRPAPPVDLPPLFSVLRTLEFPLPADRLVGHPEEMRLTEIARTPNTSYRPLAWIPGRGLIAAAEVGGDLFTRYYTLFREGRPARTELLAPMRHTFVLTGSPDSEWIVATAGLDGQASLAAWPIAEPTRLVELRPATGRALTRLTWLGQEPVVVVGDLSPTDPAAGMSASLWDPRVSTRKALSGLGGVDAMLQRPDGSGFYVWRSGETFLADPQGASRQRVAAGLTRAIAAVDLERVVPPGE